jgi:hypothetical protein
MNTMAQSAVRELDRRANDGFDVRLLWDPRTDCVFVAVDDQQDGYASQLGLRASQTPTSGFRGCTLSLVVSQRATVDGLIRAALDAGATPLKPVKKSFWGYGGTIEAPDGTLWTVATSSKTNGGPATRQIDEIVLLLGAEDVLATKRFYVDRGLEVARSFGRKYVQFDTAGVKLALYGRRALAKDAGVPPDGTGSHRIVIDGDAGHFNDPDGFAWELATRDVDDEVGAVARAELEHLWLTCFGRVGTEDEALGDLVIGAFNSLDRSTLDTGMIWTSSFMSTFPTLAWRLVSGASVAHVAASWLV